MNKEASVSLLTVLVFSAILILSVITIAFQAIDSALASSAFSNQIYAQNQAKSCLEEAVFRASNGSSSNFYFPNSTDSDKCEIVYITVTPPSEPNEILYNITINSTYKSSNYETTSTWDFSGDVPEEKP